jgi:hypothetical protein
MREVAGDIWEFHQQGNWIVITTNIGWKKNGENPMGAGIAKAAAAMYPELPAYYGRRCKQYGTDTAVCEYKPGNLILFPTKPLDEISPWASWRSGSSLDLISRSAKQLAYLNMIGPSRVIGLPLVGCQNGGLQRGDVIGILRENLDDNFILFERQ